MRLSCFLCVTLLLKNTIRTVLHIAKSKQINGGTVEWRETRHKERRITKRLIFWRKKSRLNVKFIEYALTTDYVICKIQSISKFSCVCKSHSFCLVMSNDYPHSQVTLSLNFCNRLLFILIKIFAMIKCAAC